jgi:glycerol-3-phosphate dehydrogenase
VNSGVFSVNGLHSCDLAIIGGGVNGTAIARDAAGRGYSVALFEKGDLASATSSASTKLIHGGLRYLEYGELRLVKKALAEREVFLKTAPHIVSPMRFVLPLSENTRKPWIIRLGLGLYDHLARRDMLPDSQSLDFRTSPLGDPLFGNYEQGFVYSDCWVDDARLVALQAVDAARNGAHIHTRTGVRDITPHDGMWEIETDTNLRLYARMVINATGPWVRQFLDQNALSTHATPKIRLVRGSHIVVPALYKGDQSYLMQQPDGRVVFAIPYEGKFTCIGTTDVEHDAGVDVPPQITQAETAYLCDAANRYFSAQILPQNVVWTYSGVRPLFDDGKGKAAAVTRDYHLYNQRHGGAPICSVYGGKITTARALADSVMDDVADAIGTKAGAWTQNSILPGGDLIDGDMGEFAADIAAMYPGLEAEMLLRQARAYGTWMTRFLGAAQQPADLGRDFGGGLFEAEVEYLRRVEWARTAEDILWRRSKIGLHTGPETLSALKRHLGEMG